MSSESEKDKERLLQVAKLFFSRTLDLDSFINRFVELFNLKMKTQIRPTNMKEENCIKDFFEKMIKNFKEMQLMVDLKYKQIQKDPLCSKVMTAVTSVVDKCANVGPQTAKEILKNIQTPTPSSMLSHIFESLESSLSVMMQSPIMGLRLCDFYKEETKEQSEATTSEKSTSPEFLKATTEDAWKKLQDALRIEDVHQAPEAAVDTLEQFVKTLESMLQALRKAIKTMEGDMPTCMEAGGK
ncbi:uncharacterized protein C12orf60 homolog [Meriones unguiculatus]|uniref:uncharacterized protein C12orf60 homolog n=1 Tax=Meriones unguiculatus TaxID=10047 RepID=UPI000B4EB9CC|nr:uncharacterized protein C12orf60 homolog [Meriones unguiculatus]